MLHEDILHPPTVAGAVMAWDCNNPHHVPIHYNVGAMKYCRKRLYRHLLTRSIARGKRILLSGVNFSCCVSMCYVFLRDEIADVEM